MTDLRKLINIVSEAEPTLKKTVMDLVKSTDDDTLLQKVLKTLKAGNIDERIVKVMGKDPDASKFVDKIANIIMSMDAPIEEKNAFLDKYAKGKGVLNANMLTDGKAHTFLEVCGGSNFAKDLFVILSTTLVSQGVGPGEVALAVFHPDIAWSGRAVGGGDIQIGSKAVEVKTSVSSGGRWINARKAKLDITGIENAIIEADATVMTKFFKQKKPMPRGLPARLSIDEWVNKIRPDLAHMPDVLADCAKKMANGLFNQVPNTIYAKALVSGNAMQIKDAILKVGFANYKKYSGFDGILMMDVSSAGLQYFTDYSQMAGKVKVDSAYLYAPESEAMPKVRLLPLGGAGGATGGEEPSDTGSAPAAPAAPVAKPKAAGASMSADRIQRPGALKFPEPGKAPVGSRQKR